MPSSPVSYIGVLPPRMARGTGLKMSPILMCSGGGPDLPVPVASVLLGAVLGVPYAETISAQGGTGPYTFALVSGVLPTGISLDSATGVIGGTPSAPGAYSFTIQATDSLGASGTTGFSVTVAPPPASKNYGFVG